MLSVVRERVSLWRVGWRAAYNRWLLSAVLILCGGLAVWRTIDPPQVIRERPVQTNTVDVAAAAYAQRFATAFLGFDADDPAARTAALDPFDASGDGGAGEGAQMPASGKRVVVGAQVVGRLSVPQGTRFVVGVDTKPDGRIYLAVTVTRDGRGALALVGYPAIVGGPLGGVLMDDPDGEPVTEEPLKQVVGRAMRNYLAGKAGDLAADLTDSAVVSVPVQALALQRVIDLREEAGTRGLVLVTVSARDGAGVVMTLTYEVAVENRAGRWFVSAIATDPTGH